TIIDCEESIPSESGEEDGEEVSSLSWQSRKAQDIERNGEGDTRGPSSSCSGLKRHFLDMGFPENMVEKAIKQNENGDADTVLETLLAFSALDDSSLRIYSPHDPWSPDDEYDIPDDEQSNVEVDTKNKGYEDDKCGLENSFGIDKKRLQLVEMGFPIDEITLAISRCGLYAN
ncbi:hypothetical protein EJ110_NYTH24949, partial [Nymphaea thermarum]